MHFEELFDLLDPIEIYFVFYSFHLDLRSHYYSSLNSYLDHQSVLLYLMHVRLHLQNSYQHHAFSFIWSHIVYSNGIFLRKFGPNLSWVTRTKCKM